MPVPQQMYKVELPAVWLILFFPFGLPQKSSKKEWNPLESRLQFTLGQRRLTLEAEHEPISAIPGSY